MNIEERPTALKEWIGASGAIADANIAGLGDGWALAVEFLDLHSLAIAAFSRARGSDLEAQD